MNNAERLLNEAADYIAATLEQPTDQRAWSQLLIYCPKELIIARAEALSQLTASPDREKVATNRLREVATFMHRASGVDPTWLRDAADEIDRLRLATITPDEAAIRAAAFEEAAKIAEDDERQDEWPKSVDVTRTSPSRIMQQTIAAAIRAAGEK